MKGGDKPVANPYLVLREEFDDWAILFDPDTGHACGLNPTGVYLWKLLDGKHTQDALVETIRVHAEDVPEEAGEHIAVFVDDLLALGLAGLDNTGCGLPDTPDGGVLHPEKSSSSAERFRRRVVAKDTRLCGTDKKIPYGKPTLVDFTSGRQIAYGADCGPGSSAVGYCNPQGAGAGSDCFQGTSDHKHCMGFGNSASWNCTANGSNAGTGCAACGNNLGGGSYCNSGSSVTCYCISVGSAV